MNSLSQSISISALLPTPFIALNCSTIKSCAYSFTRARHGPRGLSEVRPLIKNSTSADEAASDGLLAFPTTLGIRFRGLQNYINAASGFVGAN